MDRPVFDVEVLDYRSGCHLLTTMKWFGLYLLVKSFREEGGSGIIWKASIRTNSVPVCWPVSINDCIWSRSDGYVLAPEHNGVKRAQIGEPEGSQACKCDRGIGLHLRKINALVAWCCDVLKCDFRTCCYLPL